MENINEPGSLQPLPSPPIPMDKWQQTAEPDTNDQVPASINPKQDWIVDETIDDVNKSVNQDIFKRHKKLFWGGVVATVIWEFLIYYWLTAAPPVDNNDPRTLGFFVPIFVFIALYVHVRNKVHHEFMQQFALANDYSYQLNGAPVGLTGTLFSLGHNRAFEDVIDGNYQSHKFTLFNYIYVTGGGKSSQTHYNTVFQINYATVLPPVLLVAGMRLFSGLSPQFPDSETLKLEGDYNKYFTLYAKKEFEVEALQIFTPDFMEKTKDDYKEFSIEFSRQQLFIYFSAFIETKSELQKMRDMAEYLIKKLDPVLKGMRGDLQAMQIEQTE